MAELRIARWIQTTPGSPWREREPGPTDPGLELRLGEPCGLPWRGWGGCFNELGWRALEALPDDARADVLDDLFGPGDGCRFSFCRLPVGASDYAESWYSLNETPGDLAMERFSIERDRACLIPYIRAAGRRRADMTLFASPWSPPTWMKRPPAHNYGTLIWEPDYLRAYALYFLKFVRAYRKEGIEIAQIHPQNEPNSDQKFPSCLWTGGRMREFIRDYLGPLFASEQEPCEIWIGTIERPDYNRWANLILSDPAARACVSGVGYQWAGKGAVHQTHRSWPDVPIIQTENECGDGRNTWQYARYVFSLIHHYVTNGAVAYVYWNMVLAEGGESTWGWRQNSMVTVDAAAGRAARRPEFYVMKHCSRFIEPGARRLGLGGPWAGNAVAFANPDGARAIVVLNPFEDERAMTLREGPHLLTVPLAALSLNTLYLAG
jgi:glucosylceramidase